MRGRSAAVKTRPRASGGTEIDLMRACACALRRKATSIVPGSLTSATNSPRPWRCRSSSLRNKDAPTPRMSSGIGRLLGGHSDSGDDIGVAGAAADVACQAIADLALGSRTTPQDQVARRDQHPRRAVAALQCVMLVKIAAQRFHDPVTGEALDGFDPALVASDGEHQARARRLTVDQHRAGAAHPVLAAEMGSGQIAALTQKIG